MQGELGVLASLLCQSNELGSGSRAGGHTEDHTRVTEGAQQGLRSI